ncbi:alpha/beta-hydrolase [Epithele typhae]|uniref:alpha/beta-hydrolase n=1 Tax=Epithele typhae TaxID=378194 RepID=UPI002007E590|nr:alpha/beta-hydrolase [Epithele typhae]KAH9923439.1 alpha/beta-hydrolase [Epithele typhae]
MLSSPVFRLLVLIASATLSFATMNQNTLSAWGPCDPTVIQNPILTCATFDVPLDYLGGSAGRAQLALVKANATAEPRLGTVFYNPGGPGVSGLSDLNGSAGFLLNYTGGHYDVVSWDPRGTGISNPGNILCFDTIDEVSDIFSGSVTANGAEYTGNFTDSGDLERFFGQVDIVQQKYEEIGQRCLDKYGDTLKFLGSAYTARDLVAMTDAIEGAGSPINFVGISYGTFLGNILINMFPERVGHIILDGVVNPFMLTQTDLALSWGQFNVEADNVYRGLVAGCALAGPSGCPISTASGQTPNEVHGIMTANLQAAHDAAVANPSTQVTSSLLRIILYLSFFNPPSWAQVAQQWVEAVAQIGGDSPSNGTSSATAQLASASMLSSAMGKFAMRHRLRPQRRQESANVSGISLGEMPVVAIGCGDDIDALPNVTMRDVFEGVVNTTRNISHMTGGVWQTHAYGCNLWPVRAAERFEGPFNSTLANRVLVVGNTFDQVTAFSSAKLVAEMLGDQATLVRLNGFGHTSFGARSACLVDITSTYMANGSLPLGQDIVCEVNEDLELFPGVNTQAILAAMGSVDL